jgi:simple sugar transport system permease protein
MKKNHYLTHILNSIIPALLALLVGAIVILSIKENPLTTYWILVKKSLFTVKGFSSTLHYAAPMILTGLAIAVTFKANIFNMGVEGQFLVGGFFAGVVGSMVGGMDPITSKIICMVVGMIFGMLFALIPALLKAYYRVDELVVTLMLNYAMIKILEFLATGPFRNQGSGYVCTDTVCQNSMFTRFGNTRLTGFFFIVMAVFAVMYILMKRSKLGYEIDAIGLNPSFAEAVGMRVKKKIIILMLISGALAGLAGSGYMLSEQYKYTLSFSGVPGIGWDGMLIALLGSHSPVGIFFAAIFYSVLKTGSDNINLYTTVPNEIIGLIQSLIILFLAVKILTDKGVFGSLSKFKKVKEVK